MLAAQSGSTVMIEVLVKFGASVQLTDPGGFTPLHFAAQYGQADSVKELLKLGADPNAPEYGGGQTPLMIAAATGHSVKVATYLVDAAGISALETKDDRGATALTLAAQAGNAKLVRHLLDAGAVVDTKDDSGRTPLLLAAQVGHAVVSRILVDDGGADIDQRDRHGQTPLVIAAKHNRIGTVRVLLSLGAIAELQAALTVAASHKTADVIRRHIGMESNPAAGKSQRSGGSHKVDESAMKALFNAADRGNLQALAELLEEHEHLDLNHKRPYGTADEPDDHTALVRAALHGHHRFMDALLNAGADVCKADRDRDREMSATTIVVAYGFTKGLRVLLNHVSNPVALTPCLDFNGTSALFSAAMAATGFRNLSGNLDHHVEIMQMMLEFGYPTESERDDMMTPLMAAAAVGHLAGVNLLLSFGALVDERSAAPEEGSSSTTHNGDESALMLAARKCTGAADPRMCAAVATALVDAGAEVDLRDSLSFTPLMQAAAVDNVEVLEVLLAAGAEVNAKDDVGGTALARLVMLGSGSSEGKESVLRHKKAANLLIDAGATVDALDDAGVTPLMYAAYQGDYAIAALLVATNASLDLRSPPQTDFVDGMPGLLTAEEIADLYKNRKVERLLAKAGRVQRKRKQKATSQPKSQRKTRQGKARHESKGELADLFREAQEAVPLRGFKMFDGDTFGLPSSGPRSLGWDSDYVPGEYVYMLAENEGKGPDDLDGSKLPTICSPQYDPGTYSVLSPEQKDLVEPLCRKFGVADMERLFALRDACGGECPAEINAYDAFYMVWRRADIEGQLRAAKAEMAIANMLSDRIWVRRLRAVANDLEEHLKHVVGEEAPLAQMFDATIGAAMHEPGLMHMMRASSGMADGPSIEELFAEQARRREEDGELVSLSDIIQDSPSFRLEQERERLRREAPDPLQEMLEEMIQQQVGGRQREQRRDARGNRGRF